MPVLNVLINGYEGDVGNRILSRAFQDLHLGYCGVLNRHRRDAPILPADEYEWHGPRSLEDLDWHGIRPVDEALIERMRECEAVSMNMFSREEAQGRIIPYTERKRYYLMMLRYWNHIIEEKRINFLLSYDVPHRLRSYVISMLCKEKGIATLLCSHVDPLRDYVVFFLDLEGSIPELELEFHALNMQQQKASNIPLPKNFQRFFDCRKIELYDADNHPQPRSWSPLHIHYWKRMIIHGARLLRAQRFFRFYESNAKEPDLTKKYIYVPLHMQPEASTCPMAGAYVDQILIVQMLGALLPEDVMVYVKEHPSQQRKHPDGKCRSMHFYRDLLQVKNVCFVPRSFSTFRLMEHCLAVATSTGTAGFECLFRGKPTLLFGHYFFQHAPGLFRIHSVEDCRLALTAILERGSKPKKEELRLFLAALARCATPGYVDLHRKGYSALSEEQNVESVGSALQKKIGVLFPTS